MRTHGTLVRWNEDRGFGFIAPAEGRTEVFVHVSAFPRDGRPPRVGEVISYEVEAGGDGKNRAVRVMRPGSRSPAPAPRRAASSNGRRNPIAAVVGVVAAVAIGFYFHDNFKRSNSEPAVEYAAPNASATPVAPTASAVKPVPAAPTTPATQQFHCDGRTHCSQMTSCAEAEYFLRHCSNTQMDGNHDGEPCEQQWCD